MLVKIHARDFTLSEALRDYTDSRIRLVLGLYRDKIRRTDIFLTNVNGPKGGEDMMCKIKIEPDGHSPIIAQETANDMYNAINICSHRIKRAVGRRFDRVLQRRKGFSENVRSHKDGHFLTTI